jgi:phosphate starvation-inducible PhoH-like protein
VSKKAKRLAAKDTSVTKPEPKDTSPQVYQRDKIDWTLSIRERNDLTEKQKAIKDLILDKTTKVVFISGPAGTSKTWLAIYCGLLLLQQRRVSHITFVRTVVESASKTLGALPGELEEKFGPFMMPLLDKLEELLPSGDIKKLMAEKRVVGIPVNHLRGASMNAQYIVLEESQNYSVKELTTALTRIGQYSKVIIIGDPGQSDINGHSGFQPFYDLFNQPSSQDEGIHCVSFTKDDIVRSGILRHIVDRIEWFTAQHPKNHSS